VSGSQRFELHPLAPDLVRLEGVVSGTGMPLALHAFKGEAGWTLIDTGCAGTVGSALLPALERAAPGLAVERAIVSHAHADHFGGNSELLEHYPDCTLYAHELDRAWASDPDLHVAEAYGAFPNELPCSDEVRHFVRSLLGAPAPVQAVTDGDRFDVAGRGDLEIVHLPGHSRGHLGVWQPRSRTLVLSDALLGRGQRIDAVVVGIPAYLDIAAVHGTIERVRALNAELLLPAHFARLRGAQIHRFLESSEQFLYDMEGEILTTLQKSAPQTLRQLTESVVATLAPEADRGMVAALTVDAHLRELHQRGLCRFEVVGGVRRFEPSADGGDSLGADNGG
jgi:glyoxylase-like metal-dependent hydrolase (beta-lactamase superfamily II)